MSWIFIALSAFFIIVPAISSNQDEKWVWEKISEKKPDTSTTHTNFFGTEGTQKDIKDSENNSDKMKFPLETSRLTRTDKQFQNEDLIQQVLSPSSSAITFTYTENRPSENRVVQPLTENTLQGRILHDGFLPSQRFPISKSKQELLPRIVNTSRQTLAANREVQNFSNIPGIHGPIYQSDRLQKEIQNNLLQGSENIQSTFPVSLIDIVLKGKMQNDHDKRSSQLHEENPIRASAYVVPPDISKLPLETGNPYDTSFSTFSSAQSLSPSSTSLLDQSAASIASFNLHSDTTSSELSGAPKIQSFLSPFQNSFSGQLLTPTEQPDLSIRSFRSITRLPIAPQIKAISNHGQNTPLPPPPLYFPTASPAKNLKRHATDKDTPVTTQSTKFSVPTLLFLSQDTRQSPTVYMLAKKNKTEPGPAAANVTSDFNLSLDFGKRIKGRNMKVDNNTRDVQQRIVINSKYSQREILQPNATKFSKSATDNVTASTLKNFGHKIKNKIDISGITDLDIREISQIYRGKRNSTSNVNRNVKIGRAGQGPNPVTQHSVPFKETSFDKKEKQSSTPVKTSLIKSREIKTSSHPSFDLADSEELTFVVPAAVLNLDKKKHQITASYATNPSDLDSSSKLTPAAPFKSRHKLQQHTLSATELFDTEQNYARPTFSTATDTEEIVVPTFTDSVGQKSLNFDLKERQNFSKDQQHQQTYFPKDSSYEENFSKIQHPTTVIKGVLQAHIPSYQEPDTDKSVFVSHLQNNIASGQHDYINSVEISETHISDTDKNSKIISQDVYIPLPASKKHGASYIISIPIKVFKEDSHEESATYGDIKSKNTFKNNDDLPSSYVNPLRVEIVKSSLNHAPSDITIDGKVTTTIDNPLKVTIFKHGSNSQLNSGNLHKYSQVSSLSPQNIFSGISSEDENGELSYVIPAVSSDIRDKTHQQLHGTPGRVEPISTYSPSTLATLESSEVDQLYVKPSLKEDSKSNIYAAPEFSHGQQLKPDSYIPSSHVTSAESDNLDHSSELSYALSTSTGNGHQQSLSIPSQFYSPPQLTVDESPEVHGTIFSSSLSETYEPNQYIPPTYNSPFQEQQQDNIYENFQRSQESYVPPDDSAPHSFGNGGNSDLTYKISAASLELSDKSPQKLHSIPGRVESSQTYTAPLLTTLQSQEINQAYGQPAKYAVENADNYVQPIVNSPFEVQHKEKSSRESLKILADGSPNVFKPSVSISEGKHAFKPSHFPQIFPQKGEDTLEQNVNSYREKEIPLSTPDSLGLREAFDNLKKKDQQSIIDIMNKARGGYPFSLWKWPL